MTEDKENLVFVLREVTGWLREEKHKYVKYKAEYVLCPKKDKNKPRAKAPF